MSTSKSLEIQASEQHRGAFKIAREFAIS